MKGIQAKIDNIFSKANDSKAKALSETDESMAAAEKPSQVLKTIQPALTHSQPTPYLNDLLRLRTEQTANGRRAPQGTLATRKYWEGSRVVDMDRRLSSAITIDLTGEKDATSMKTNFGSSSHSFQPISKPRQHMFTSRANQYLYKESLSGTGFSNDHGGQPFLSAKGESYGQPICIDEDPPVSLAKSRKPGSVSSARNDGPTTEDDAKRDARAEREMHREWAMMEKNLAIKRQAGRQNEIEARNKRLRFSLTSTDALPRAKTVLQRGRTDEADVLTGALAIMGSGKATEDRRHFGSGISSATEPLQVLSTAAPAFDSDLTAMTVQTAGSQESREDQKKPGASDLSQEPLDLALLQPWDVEGETTTIEIESLHVPEEILQGTSGAQETLPVLRDTTQTSLLSAGNLPASPAPCSGMETTEHPSIPSAATLVDDDSSRRLQTQNTGVHNTKVDGDPAKNWYKRFITSEESLCFPEKQHNRSGNTGSCVFYQIGPQCDLRDHSGNVHNPITDGGPSGNPTLASEEPLPFPETHDGLSIPSSLVFSKPGSSGELQAHSDSGHKAIKDGESSENHVLPSEESLFFLGSRYDTHTAVPESFEGIGRNNNAATSRIGAGKQPAADNSRGSKEPEALLVVQEEKYQVPNNPQNHESKDYKTSVCKSVEDFEEAGLGTLYCQAPGNKNPSNHEDCREQAPLLPKTGQPQSPGANSLKRKMTTPERKEARRQSSKKCQDKKRDALRHLKAQPNLNLFDISRRSSSNISYVTADRDRLESAHSPPAAFQDVGFATTAGKRRMTTPERKESKRRAAQKFAAKKKLERLSRNGQNGLDSQDTSRRSSSEVPNGSRNPTSRGEKQAHRHVPWRPLPIPTPEVVCEGVQAMLQNQRSTTGRKGVAQKTTASIDCMESDIVGREDPEFDELEEEDVESEIEGTEAEMLFHYFVTRTERRADEPDDVDREALYGPYHTLMEANTVASDVLLHFESADSFSTEHSAGWSSDANGLKEWHFVSETTEVQVAVTREIKRKAKLRKGAGRIPPKVYEAYQRRVDRFGNTHSGNQFTHLHLGTFTLLDLANRHAARAWVAVEIGELPDTPYTREVARPSKEREIQHACDKLEETGGFFQKQLRVKRDGVEIEVDLWVEEREVLGPRN
ncbi:hypothetical protein MMC30_003313 [Trapelia coarctata]|nr:hypothetical protein [Trapelia coarctata]